MARFLALLVLGLAACAAPRPSGPGAGQGSGAGPGLVGGLTADQIGQLRSLEAPVLVPTQIGDFAVDGFQASRTDYGTGYSIAYRRADGSCFEVNGTNEGVGGPGYPIVQMDVTIGALGQPSRIYKASDDPNATSAQSWGPNTVVSEHVEVGGMVVTFLSASVSGCRPLALEEAGPIFASLSPLAGDPVPGPPSDDSEVWADGTDVLDVIGGVAGEDPETAAFAAFATEEEGTDVLVETLRQSSASATVLVTMLDLADDSVRDERFRIEYAEGEQGYWRAVAAQRQVRCWPGRGHQGWGPSACL